MITHKILAALTTILLPLFAASSHAGQDDIDFDFIASAGVEYDSNVGITDIDSNSGEADTATKLAAGMAMTLAPRRPVSLRLGYDYSDTAYRQFSEYDIGLHHAQAEIELSHRILNASLSADRFSGVLDGEDYLTLTRFSPSVSRLFGNRVFVRGAAIAAEKEYDSLPDRSAESDSLRLDSYLLLDGMDHYLSVSLQRTAEEALSPELDFDATRYSLGYGYTFKLPLMQLKLKAQMRYEQRDYLGVTEIIGERRADRRMRASLTAQIPFTDHFALEGSIEQSDVDSNLPAAVSERRRYGIGFKVDF